MGGVSRPPPPSQANPSRRLTIDRTPRRDPRPLPRSARLGLGPLGDLPVAYLSAGQRRRVGLARLLVATRPLWLLDEPINALDAAAQGLLRDPHRRPSGGRRPRRRGDPCEPRHARGAGAEAGRVRAALWALFRRDLTLARRIGGGGSLGVVFFLSLVTIVPFAIGPDLNLLARIGPAILWISALLAGLLGLDRLFQADEDDGSLDLLRLGPVPLELVVLVKCLAHWCVTGLPLVLAAPLFGLMLALDGPALGGRHAEPCSSARRPSPSWGPSAPR